MTPIAREFSQEERDAAVESIIDFYYGLPSQDVAYDAAVRHARREYLLSGNPNLHVGLERYIMLQCTVNHLTAQVEEAREIIMHSRKHDISGWPNEEYLSRQKLWLSANPVRTEEKL